MNTQNNNINLLADNKALKKKCAILEIQLDFKKQYDELLKKQKKKFEFSKIHVIFANIIVSFSFILSFILNFILMLKDKQQIDFSVPLSIVTIYGGFATSGYFAQNMVLKSSINKLKSKCLEYDVNLDEANP